MEQEIVDRLEAGLPVDLALGDSGRLHIDRPVPFLCVYRWQDRAPEADRRALVSSQAAWLVVPTDFEASALLCALGRWLEARFGGWLLLELWTEPLGEASLPRPGFEIHAPAHGVPNPVLEALEGALLKVRLRGRSPEVRLRYEPEIAPPGLSPLLSDEQTGACGCTCLGLAVDPVYREPEGGEVHVFAHRAFRRRLDIALRRAFHAFAHACTTHRPAHYHELGPQRIPEVAFEIDAELADIGEHFDLLLHVTPVNAEAAWSDFRNSGFSRPPEFLYRPRTADPDLLKRRLFAIPLETLEDPALYEMFAAKRDELDRQITLLSDRGTPRFLLGSRQLFGDVEPRRMEAAERLLETLEAGHTDDPKHHESLDARALADRACEEVARYRALAPDFATRVEVREDVAGILVSHGDFLVGADARVAARRVEAALAHEIGTHALPWYNGSRQPFRELRAGMAGYEPLQEGLAVLAEYLVGQLDPGRLRQLAGRVIAVHMACEGADFVEVFRHLHDERGFGARPAFMTTMRTFRGGGYVKDAIYLRGLQALLECLGEGLSLETLYVGKVSLEFLPLVEELRWRSLIEPPALLPWFLEHVEVQQRLARLQAGMNLMDLAREAGECASASS